MLDPWRLMTAGSILLEREHQSNKLAVLPRISTHPLVGCVIRDSTFNKVDLPAPFLPIIPTVSPRLISKDTSLSAHNISDEYESVVL